MTLVSDAHLVQSHNYVLNQKRKSQQQQKQKEQQQKR
jgi:hypothetical protein